MLRTIAVTMTILALVRGEAQAAGGSPKPIPSSPRAESPRLTPQQEAAASYNSGLKHLEKAGKHEKAAAAAPDAKKRAALEQKARKEYDRAIKDLRFAIGKDPELFQAHGSLGYALRKIGDYPASLAAYDHALSLSPSYAPAIEYRAEACLGLGRLEEAKAAYMTLFNTDRPRADELAAAMKAWVEDRRQNPAGLSPSAIEEFARWVAQREEIAGRTGALLPAKDDRW
jgi:tetratricopeptide (TPR) repeat protein